MYLAQLLRHRPRSIGEARQRLCQHGYDPDVVEATVEQAVAAGLLDDAAFTKLWIRDRVWHHPLSRAALRKELHEKSIPPELIGKVMDEEYLPAREIELARELAAERLQRLRDVPPDKRTDRTLRFLSRRGFSLNQARDAVRRAEEATDDGM